MSEQEILNRAKDNYINSSVEDSFNDWNFVTDVLSDYFKSHVNKMNTKEFKEYLKDYGYEEEAVESFFV